MYIFSVLTLIEPLAILCAFVIFLLLILFSFLFQF